MTEHTHTPGPWHTESDRIWQEGDSPWPIAYYGDGANREANARLIAAAPDLLAALEAVHACHRAFSGSDDWGMLDDEARAIAEAAIARATGVD